MNGKTMQVSMRVLLVGCLFSGTALTGAQAAGTGPSVMVTPNPLSAGAQATGMVMLSTPASAPVTVYVSTSNGQFATVSGSPITIPAGSETGTFTVQAMATKVGGSCTITASDYSAGTREAGVTSLDVVPNGLLASVTITPNPINGGGHAIGTVSLAAPASAPVTFNATTSDGYVATVASSPITIPAGSMTGTFTVMAADAQANSSCSITVSDYANGPRQAIVTTVNVAPRVALASVVITPSPLAAGAQAMGTVTLAAPVSAPVTVYVTTDNGSVATVGSSPITIAAGSTTATFTVTATASNIGGSCTITASDYSTGTREAILTHLEVVPSGALSSVVITPNPLSGGAQATGTVTLSAPAAADVTIFVTTSDGRIATVGSSPITIPAGSMTASFTVTAAGVLVNSSCLITVSNYATGARQAITTTLIVAAVVSNP